MASYLLELGISLKAKEKVAIPSQNVFKKPILILYAVNLLEKQRNRPAFCSQVFIRKVG